MKTLDRLSGLPPTPKDQIPAISTALAEQVHMMEPLFSLDLSSVDLVATFDPRWDAEQ